MKSIDLNCDVGEGVGNEALLMPFLSSCNISCGLHAGDDTIIKTVIDLALKNEVAIGAHPSFDDRANFGRTELDISTVDLEKLVYGQIFKMKKMAEDAGGKMAHVKPHGAMYNMAARSEEMSCAIINAILNLDPNLKLMGLANSKIAKASEGRIAFIAEGFADRKYDTSTSLKARGDGGLITDFAMIEAQLKMLLKQGLVETDNGLMPLHIESLCLHGDSPNAEVHVARIHELILSMGIEIEAA